MGICLLPIVKSMNFTNCLGFRKGTYGIDQASFSGWGVQESATAVSINHSEQSYNNQALVNILLS